MLAYRARLAGITILQPSKHDISRTCRGCGGVSANSRGRRGLYPCSEWGATMKADANGPVSICASISKGSYAAPESCSSGRFTPGPGPTIGQGLRLGEAQSVGSCSGQQPSRPCEMEQCHRIGLRGARFTGRGASAAEAAIENRLEGVRLSEEVKSQVVDLACWRLADADMAIGQGWSHVGQGGTRRARTGIAPVRARYTRPTGKNPRRRKGAAARAPGSYESPDRVVKAIGRR